VSQLPRGPSARHVANCPPQLKLRHYFPVEEFVPAEHQGHYVAVWGYGSLDRTAIAVTDSPLRKVSHFVEPIRQVSTDGRYQLG
jgi:hypothetical protein